MTVTRSSLFMKMLAPALVLPLIFSSKTLQAQPPRQNAPMVARAREACDAAVNRSGYRIMRRDRENVNGSSYELPMHVSHAGNTNQGEGDITCRYDTQRGTADLSGWDYRRGENARDYGLRQGNTGNTGMAQQAESLCQNFINSRRGYELLQTGTPTRHGRNLYDVPVTVRRNGRREMSMTCRYNAASNKLSLR